MQTRDLSQEALINYLLNFLNKRQKDTDFTEIGFDHGTPKIVSGQKMALEVGGGNIK